MKLATWILSSVLTAAILTGGAVAEARTPQKAKPQSKNTAAVNAKSKAKKNSGGYTAKRPKAKGKLLSWSQFSKMPKKHRAGYIKGLQRLAKALELKGRKSFSYAENRYQWPESFSLVPYAHAEDVQSCLIGGIERALRKNPAGELKCPTRGRECPGKPNSFQCGAIWNRVCVDREPISAEGNGISERCEASWKALPEAARDISKKDYDDVVTTFQAVMSDCDDGSIHPAYGPRCEVFKRRLDELAAKDWNASVDVAVDNGGGTPAVTEPDILTDAEVAEDQTTPAPELSTPVTPAPIIPDKIAPIPMPRLERPETTTPAPIVTNTPDAPVLAGDLTAAERECITKRQTKYGSLACLQCGMEKTQPYAKELVPGSISRWMNLLGIMAQTYYGPLDQKQLQVKVQNMLASYGYCLDSEFPIGDKYSGNASFIRQLVNGEVRLTNKPDQNGPNENKFADIFGFWAAAKSDRTGLPTNSGKPMLFPNALFLEANGTFAVDKLQERQWRFLSIATKHVKSNTYTNGQPANGMSACLKKVVARLNKVEMFGFCR